MPPDACSTSRSSDDQPVARRVGDLAVRRVRGRAVDQPPPRAAQLQVDPVEPPRCTRRRAARRRSRRGSRTPPPSCPGRGSAAPRSTKRNGTASPIGSPMPTATFAVTGRGPELAAGALRRRSAARARSAGRTRARRRSRPARARSSPAPRSPTGRTRGPRTSSSSARTWSGRPLGLARGRAATRTRVSSERRESATAKPMTSTHGAEDEEVAAFHEVLAIMRDPAWFRTTRRPKQTSRRQTTASGPVVRTAS